MLGMCFTWRLTSILSLIPFMAATACGGTAETRDSGVQGDGSGRAVRILPLGDSITEGIDACSSYRYWLGRGLQDIGVTFDFVGSLRGPRGGKRVDSFDADHEGHWGWRADQVAPHLDAWLAAAQADVVLVHLGHNDLGAGEAPEDVAREVAELVARIRAYPSPPRVLAAEVILADGMAARIERLNQALAAELLASADPDVHLVDLATGFDARRQTADGIHPNEEGARWMAERWLRALLEILEST